MAAVTSRINASRAASSAWAYAQQRRPCYLVLDKRLR